MLTTRPKAVSEVMHSPNTTSKLLNAKYFGTGDLGGLVQRMISPPILTPRQTLPKGEFIVIPTPLPILKAQPPCLSRRALAAVDPFLH
jgi:hypothetical protein